MPPDAICRGWVKHTRHTPVRHEFRYHSNMLWLNLETLADTFSISSLWSLERFNLLSFYQQDYLDNSTDLVAAVRKRVSEISDEPVGPIYILTHPRHLGHVFNPVSFYFCYDQAGESPQYLIAEVNNTPWGERFSYVLPITPVATNNGVKIQAHCAKSFHVSPFMPMDLEYRWLIRLASDRITIHIALDKAAKTCFDAVLHLQMMPITTTNAAALALQRPLHCLQDLAAIYWQALKLWRQRVPYYSHPRKIMRQAQQ